MSWITELFRSLSSAVRPWVIVAPWEQAVRVRLGRRVDLLGPGVHFRAPIADRAVTLCTRERRVQEHNQTMQTADGSVFTMTIAVTYSIGNAKQMLESIAQPEATIMIRAQSCVAKVVSEMPGDGVCPSAIEKGAADGFAEGVKDWGLAGASIQVLGFAKVRTYRLLMNDYSTRSGIDDLVNGIQLP